MGEHFLGTSYPHLDPVKRCIRSEKGNQGSKLGERRGDAYKSVGSGHWEGNMGKPEGLEEDQAGGVIFINDIEGWGRQISRKAQKTVSIRCIGRKRQNGSS